MRIIAGTARSLPLKAVEGTGTRPTTDRIRETLFNILAPRIGGAVFLDLFAGSGAVGLEAVSRGAERAVLVDHSAKAVSCIRENVHTTKFDAQCEVIRSDFLAALRHMEGRDAFDIIFLDPPYGQGLAAEALAFLRDSTLCDRDTLVIVEEHISFDVDELTREGYLLLRDKQYKTNRHLFMQKEA